MALEMGTLGSQAYQAVQQQDATRAESLVDRGTTKPMRLPPRTFPKSNSVQYLALISLCACLISGLSIFLLVLLRPRRPPNGGLNSGVLGDRSCESIGYIKGNGSDTPGAFRIDLQAPGHLNFAEAKLIDVMWDLFVGQGGRFLLAWISYRVLMDALLRHMETSPMSYQLYATLVFDTTSVFAILGCLKELLKSRGWRMRALMAWFGVATFYVLGFPTLMGAATGYVNPSESYFPIDGSLMPFPSKEISQCLVVTEGSRVGLKDGQLVMGRVSTEYPGWGPPSLYRDLMEAYQGDSPYNVTINNHNYILDHRLVLEPTYCYNNATISQDLVPQCIPKPFFVWGFSSLILYITFGLQLLWTIGMTALWLDSIIKSPLCCMGRRLRGPFRAAIDLAEAVQEILGDDLCTYSESEIERELKKESQGLRYYVSEPNDDSVAHLGISSSRESTFFLRTDVRYGRTRLTEH